MMVLIQVKVKMVELVKSKVDSIFKKLTLLNLVLIWLIMITGALVRLTNSGLGCATWPKCDVDSFSPKVNTFHSNIEWGNRLITAAVSIVILLVLFFSIFTINDKRKKIYYSALVFFGIVLQIVLGGITVLSHLNPYAVGSHLIVSLYLIIVSKILYIVACDKKVVINKWYFVSYSFLVITVLAGIAVTGAGPHAGDGDAQRFGWTILEAARVHSFFAWMTLLSLVLLVWRKKITKSRQLYNFATLLVVQMTIGYVQYILKVPAGLVALHIAVLGLIAASLISREGSSFATHSDENA